jgi:hypothetical protein
VLTTLSSACKEDIYDTRDLGMRWNVQRFRWYYLVVLPLSAWKFEFPARFPVCSHLIRAEFTFLPGRYVGMSVGHVIQKCVVILKK